MAFLRLILISTLATVCFGKATESSDKKVTGLRDCKNEYSVMCFKVDIANFVEKISKVDDVNLIGGLSIVKDNNYNDTSATIVAGKLLTLTSFKVLLLMR